MVGDNFDGPGQSPWFYLRYAGVIFSWVALAGLALWVARLWWRRGEDLRWEGFLWLWAALLIAVFSVLGHKEPRYVMPAAPPVFLLAGVGLSWLLRGRGRFARVAGPAALAVALGWSFWPLRTRFQTGFVDHSVSEEMNVAEYLNETAPAGTVLYMDLSYADFAHYTNFAVEALPESGEPLYDHLGKMAKDGIFNRV